MLSVPLRPDTEQRLAELAKSRGLSKADLAQELIELSLVDLDDIPDGGRALGKSDAAPDERAGQESTWAGRLNTIQGQSMTSTG